MHILSNAGSNDVFEGWNRGMHEIQYNGDASDLSDKHLQCWSVFV